MNDQSATYSRTHTSCQSCSCGSVGARPHLRPYQSHTSTVQHCSRWPTQLGPRPTRRHVTQHVFPLQVARAPPMRPTNQRIGAAAWAGLVTSQPDQDAVGRASQDHRRPQLRGDHEAAFCAACCCAASCCTLDWRVSSRASRTRCFSAPIVCSFSICSVTNLMRRLEPE